MKKYFIGFILLTSLFSSAAWSLRCSKAPDGDPKQAEKCAHEFLGHPDDLYAMAQGKGHLGDVTRCAAAKDRKSYFTQDQVAFQHGINNAHVASCVLANDYKDQYVCYIETGPNACYIGAGVTGVNTQTFIMKIGATVPNLITVYPIKQRP